MIVDVVYQGLALVKGANARSQADGVFVELDVPMPVGTRLELVTPDGNQSGRVESVVEGTGAGMLVGFGARKAASPDKAPVAKKEAEPNAPMAEMKSAPPVPLAAEKDDSDDEDGPEPADEKPDDSGKKGKRNRKPRKTVIGR
jgi:hypothetical protein